MLSFLLWVVVITIIKLFKDNDFSTSKSVHSSDRSFAGDSIVDKCVDIIAELY